ncbi:hypothetical protein M436DRAFT_61846 [Aureobasidium namibiae CBS 147.97]|uniref:C2H2-type domain-containing protein n=1 Tax=Aureobasidium namibiae CBS 147.97 TaxID=1043004 RepID=A0A074XLK6_9PEZI
MAMKTHNTRQEKFLQAIAVTSVNVSEPSRNEKVKTLAPRCTCSLKIKTAADPATRSFGDPPPPAKASALVDADAPSPRVIRNGKTKTTADVATRSFGDLPPTAGAAAHSLGDPTAPIKDSTSALSLDVSSNAKTATPAPRMGSFGKPTGPHVKVSSLPSRRAISHPASFDASLKSATSSATTLNTTPAYRCLMGCPATFTTIAQHPQHFIRFECPESINGKTTICGYAGCCHVFPDSEPSTRAGKDNPYDVLMHTPDPAEDTRGMQLPPTATAKEFATLVSKRARLSSVPTVYDSSVYSETPHAFAAVIRDIDEHDERFVFPGASQMTVKCHHMQAFNDHGMKPTFVNTKTREKFDNYLLDRTAADVAAAAKGDVPPGATVLFKCPVPGCKRGFGPSTLVSEFYNHLEDPVHWVYYDDHGIQCGFGCGRGFANATCLSRHISERRCMATGDKKGDAIVCPNPPVGGFAVECLSQAWDKLDLALSHWMRYHTNQLYRDGVTENSCFVCEATFAIEDMLVAHFHNASSDSRSSTKPSTHGQRLLSRGLLWNCEREWLHVVKFYPVLPSVQLLMAIHHLAIRPSFDKIATNYITNQMLYAKLNELRALVITMGQNAFCHNWARESRFMRMYTVMHGRLEVTVCTPATELKNNNRGESTSVMCPSTLGKYAVGCYDSTEVINHNSGNRPNAGIEELARRVEVTEKSLEDMTRARRST